MGLCFVKTNLTAWAERLVVKKETDAERPLRSLFRWVRDGEASPNTMTFEGLLGVEWMEWIQKSFGKNN